MPPRPAPMPCGLCGRLHDRDQLTKHHTLPKSRGGTADDVALVCSQCHGMVHATYTNKTLEAVYPTLDALRDAPELAAFLAWVRKQRPGSLKRNRSRRRKL